MRRQINCKYITKNSKMFTCGRYSNYLYNIIWIGFNIMCWKSVQETIWPYFCSLDYWNLVVFAIIFEKWDNWIFKKIKMNEMTNENGVAWRIQNTEAEGKQSDQVLMTICSGPNCQFPLVDFGRCVGDIKSNLENKQGSLFANYLAMNLPDLAKQYNH